MVAQLNLKEFVKTLRADSGDVSELRESFRRFGWVKYLPAIVDENGLVLVGNRRLKAAKLEGIEPIILTVTLGQGDAADAERLKLALASNLGGESLTKEDRKRIAEHLYGKKEWTMERIAEALNVAQSTITEDLRNLSTVDKSKPAKTASNPKGAGRPKGSRKPPAPPRGADAVVALADQGLSTKDIAAETGVSERQVRRAIEEEALVRKGRKDAEIDRSALSLTAQQKLDAAIRQAKRKLDLEFDLAVREEASRRLDEITLPYYTQKLERLERLITSRRGVMDKTTYNKILGCLHVERLIQLLNISITALHEPTARRYDEAFTIFVGLEKLLLSEKESPTEFRHVPRTTEELLKARAEVRAANSARAKAAHARRARGETSALRPK